MNEYRDMEMETENDEVAVVEEIGCKFCWDSRKQREKKRMTFFDPANNMRLCKFCPWCGRPYYDQED